LHYHESTHYSRYVICANGLIIKMIAENMELAEKYRGRSELKYRYWKSDSDTLDWQVLKTIS